METNEKRIKPKINPKDNTITIKKIKDSWNREEVENLLEKIMHHTHEYGKMNIIDYKKWIEENL